MRIKYSNGTYGVHQPYEFSFIKTREDFDRSRQVWDREANPPVVIAMDDCSIEWELADINYIAGLKIRAAYPEHKQLNILRSQDTAAIARMNTFIEAVRAWANSDVPDPWDGTLDAIQPE
jgi:hypothetical protein